MFEVFYYKDKQGNQPVREYILELNSRKDKESRIKTMGKRNDISPVGDSWEEDRKILFTPEENAASDLRVGEFAKISDRMLR